MSDTATEVVSYMLDLIELIAESAIVASMAYGQRGESDVFQIIDGVYFMPAKRKFVVEEREYRPIELASVLRYDVSKCADVIEKLYVLAMRWSDD